MGERFTGKARAAHSVRLVALMVAERIAKKNRRVMRVISSVDLRRRVVSRDFV